MANKDFKTRTPISNPANTELLNRLKAYSEETEIPISKLLDKSISSFLKSTKK
ncbi:ribbon-helix-helix domain-containing protein [Clostridium botulinum]|uniref:ribbon-helix-helix domain-containing protein n=1 Tax=Clostridium botulinum TaxID=1491 RepID=UPI0009919A71|nr:ribbon-helix-helix domain-containing protein [Clostridium botulinum]MCD3351584.1 ribbon-helix-helix domain-containing protein [Clostridium botulinum D/C]MCD3360529.1 ribbon-helix-helix domain-containing protein [Clostridium botulinum D/C]MCD3362213.1 ribbon-helix-helix domain-containing protein [Clostridium botulinum D/C]MCD3366285.1 ribbon-helix-helix domain-containing protein [Clostridium botulinum D/C]NFO98184.1 ribbon-helix-helix domain-containing protein [Clostridium botulinum]